MSRAERDFFADTQVVNELLSMIPPKVPKALDIKVRKGISGFKILGVCVCVSVNL